MRDVLADILEVERTGATTGLGRRQRGIDTKGSRLVVSGFLVLDNLAFLLLGSRRRLSSGLGLSLLLGLRLSGSGLLSGLLLRLRFRLSFLLSLRLRGCLLLLTLLPLFLLLLELLDNLSARRPKLVLGLRAKRDAR